MNPEFWRRKKVFLTGHTGFKGAWLSLWLEHLGASVIGYSLAPPTQPNLFETLGLAKHMISLEGDIRNYDKLHRAISEHQPEIVIHMAAQSLVRYSYQNPLETYGTNVLGTANLLEAARHTPSIKAIISVTTDKCYENKEWLWAYRENEPLGGFDPYSSSKGCAELVTAAYRRSYGMSLASARAGNVIGGGDWALDRLIPDIMRSCSRKEDLLIRHPEAIRPWQHVLEPLSGYLGLAEALYQDPQGFGEAWNFGPNEDDAKPVAWIVDRVLELWNENLSWKRDHDPQPHEATYLKLDCAKAKARLHWQPRWSLEEALQHIVTWYKAYQRHEDMRVITLAQIQHFSGDK